VEQLNKNPLEFVKREGFDNAGSLIFYVACTDNEAINQLQIFRSNLVDNDWFYQVAHGTVGTITLNNGAEVTFLPESEAFVLLELPNSNTIFFELTSNNRELAESLMMKTSKLMFVDPVTKELVQ
jgi:hypothetical protein